MLMFVLTKNGELKHTVSRVKKERLEAEGWRTIINLSGWNISISYVTGKV